MNNIRNTRNNETVLIDGKTLTVAPVAPLTVLTSVFSPEQLAAFSPEQLTALVAGLAPASASNAVNAVNAVKVTFDPAARQENDAIRAATWCAVIIGAGNLSGILPCADQYSAYKVALGRVETLRARGVKFSGSGKRATWEGIASGDNPAHGVVKIYFWSAAELAGNRALYAELFAMLDTAPRANLADWDGTFNYSYSDSVGFFNAQNAAPENAEEKIPASIAPTTRTVHEGYVPNEELPTSTSAPKAEKK